MYLSLSYAEIADNVTLPYIDHGERSGRPVIFLHGATDSHRSFGRMLPYLPRSVRAIAVTQRGHGDASRPASGYDPATMSEDVRRFMDAIGVDRAVIAGHSMGSYIAQRFAIDHPEMVEKLILIGSFATIRGNEAAAEFCETAVPQLADPIDPEFVWEFQASTIERSVPAEFIDMVVNESLKVPAGVWKDVFGNLLDDDHTSELGRIKAETLLIRGERDAFFNHSDQTRLLASIRNASMNIYTGTGHSPHWEEPERVAADIVEFIGAGAAAERRAVEAV